MLGEKRVAGRHRTLLVDTLKLCMDEEWLVQMPTSLLRQMVGYVEMEVLGESVPVQRSAAEASRNDAIADSKDGDAAKEEEMS